MAVRVAGGNDILAVPEVVIHPRGRVVVRVRVGERIQEIVAVRTRRAKIRQRHVLRVLDLERYRADPGGGQNVAVEGLPRRGIVNDDTLGQQRGKIAVAHSLSRNGGQVAKAARLEELFPIEEEKRPVLSVIDVWNYDW